MSKPRRLLISALLAAVSFATCLLVLVSPAPAADKGGPAISSNIFADAPVGKINWSGIYIGLHGGYGVADGALSFGPATIDGLAASGAVGGIHAGADVQIHGSMLVLGLRGDYTWSHEEFSISAPGGAFKASLHDGWGADARVGLALGTALPYLFVGYTQEHTAASLTGGPAISAPDLRGWRVGGGVEFRIPKMTTETFNTTLAAEYKHTDFSEVTLGGPGGPKLNVTDDVFMTRLNFRFGESYSK